MLIVILIDVQYLQNDDFGFDKGVDGHSQPSWVSHHPKPFWQNLLFP